MGLSGTATAAAALLAVGGLLLLTAPATQTAAPQQVDAPAATAVRVRYEWPTGSPRGVVRAFVTPPERWAAGHRGVDLDLAAGAPVQAAADGVVAFAGSVAGRGVVSVDHPDGVRTTYEPVAPAVRAGLAVSGGDVLGELEAHGHHCAPAPCLHWGARRGRDEYLDPMLLLTDDVVIRLLPERRP